MRYLTDRPVRTHGSLLDFPRSVEDIFQRFWGTMPAMGPTTWQPAADVVETPQAYLLHLDLPGIDPELVDVTLTGEVLTIRGEKRAPEKGENDNWLLNERAASTFERSFTLPSVAQKGEIQAEARHGVLTVRIPKAKEAQPLRVQIKKA